MIRFEHAQQAKKTQKLHGSEFKAYSYVPEGFMIKNHGQNGIVFGLPTKHFQTHHNKRLVIFSRFDHPKQMMAYLGLIPGEYSSGNITRSKGIAKIGNKEVRRLLYEAAWSYRNNAKVGSWMLAHTPPAVTQVLKDIAWQAQQRLCFRYRSLAAKGKKSQVSITAVARELIGFMWDIVCTYRQQYSTA